LIVDDDVVVVLCFWREVQFLSWEEEGVLYMSVVAWGTWKKLGKWEGEEWEI